MPRLTKAQKKAAAKVAAKDLALRGAAAAGKAAAKKKKKSSGWGKLLLKGVETAASLAPEVLPLLLAGHGPSKMAAQANPGAFAGVPIAQSSTIGTQVGLKDYKVLDRSTNGTVKKVRVTTMDFLGPLGSSGYSSGDVIFKALLSPASEVFQGTSWNKYSQLFERYRITRGALIFESVCPATTSGAVVGAHVDDPLAQFPADTGDATNGGVPLIREVSTQSGSDEWQVWAEGCFAINTPSGQDMLFVDPDGADARQVAQGQVIFVAAADIANGSAFGNVYMLFETEFAIPSITETSGLGTQLRIGQVSTDSKTIGGMSYRPFGDGSETVLFAQTMPGTFQYDAPFTDKDGNSVSGNCVRDLRPGYYGLGVDSTWDTTTTYTSPLIVSATSEALAYGVAQVGFIWDSSLSYTAQYKHVSAYDWIVPDGIPAGTPIFYWWCNVVCAGDSTQLWAWMTMLDPDIYNAGESLTSGALSDAKLLRKTIQGRVQRELQDLTAIRMALWRQTPPSPAPIKGGRGHHSGRAGVVVTPGESLTPVVAAKPVEAVAKEAVAPLLVAEPVGAPKLQLQSTCTCGEHHGNHV
jgi:hypothetical protein